MTSRPSGDESADGRVVLVAGSPFDTLAVTTPDGRQVKLHSQRDPAGEADRLVASAFDAAEPSTAIVIGAGLGYVLESIARRSANTRVVVFEPLPECLPLLVKRYPVGDWQSSGRLAVFAGPGYEGATDAFRLVDERAGPPVILMNPVIKREFPREAARAQAAAEALIAGARANESARLRFAGPYLVNTLKNLPAMAAEGDVASLALAFSGRPAIVAAAGPSLDRLLPHLRALPEDVLLIAVDTALRPLLTAGITPHFVVAVDPQPNNARHLLNLPPAADTWLVAEGSMDPSVLPAFAGRIFVFQVSQHQPWPWLAASGFTRGGLRAWGSVLTTAVDLACHLGCDPVVFAGADLAYTDGLLYCRNTTYEPDWKSLETDDARAAAFQDYVRSRSTVTATDTSGKTVPTTPLFVQFRDWIVARTLAEPTRRFVNATGAGILRGGRIELGALDALSAVPPQAAFPVRHRIGVAWATGRGDREGVLRSVGHRLVPTLAGWPPDERIEPLKSFLTFTGDLTPSPELLASLITLLGPEKRAAIVDGLRRHLTALPEPGPARDVWTALSQGGTWSALPVTWRPWDEVPPWPVPDSWTSPPADNNPEPGLGATALSMITPEAALDFHSPWYLHLNARRLEHLASLGLDLRRRSVLEVGAGVGDLTSFFSDRECAVLATDARDDNVRQLAHRYGHHPFVTTARLCLDPPPADPVGRFDVVFCYGVLYHLADPGAALSYLASCCGGMLLVDSAVHGEPELDVVVQTKDASVPTASVSGVLATPGRSWLYGQLRELFEYVYVPAIQPNHYLYPVDWGRPLQPGSRAMIVASRRPIDSALLLRELPSRQRRH